MRACREGWIAIVRARKCSFVAFPCNKHNCLLTIAASRQILLENKDIEARSASLAQLDKTENARSRWDPDNRNNPARLEQVLVRFPLHAGCDKMVVALLTIQWFSTEETVKATKEWDARLGGAVCTSFLLRQMYSARADNKDAYQALHLYKILKVEAVIGGLYGQGAEKRRRTG